MMTINQPQAGLSNRYPLLHRGHRMEEAGVAWLLAAAANRVNRVNRVNRANRANRVLCKSIVDLHYLHRFG